MQLTLELNLLPTGTTVFPVYITGTASAIKSSFGEKTRLRIFQKTILVGYQSVEKLPMAKQVTKPTPAAVPVNHPQADLAIISTGITMKMPDVFPKDYAMCEVHIGVSFLGARSAITDEAKAMLQAIAPDVQGMLNEIAVACGGTPPFKDSVSVVAAHGADIVETKA